MVSIFIIILVISQLLCFYFILLLNMKVAKFKDLERRQDQVLKEMDDSISLYLMEMKEENDRLIKELSSVKNTKKEDAKNSANKEVPSIVKKENKPPKEKEQELQEKDFADSKVFIPKSKVKNAYNQQKTKSTESSVKSEKKVEKEEANSPTFEQKVITLYKNGTSIEEIAKITQKGKTEIELLVKFHA